MTRSCCSLLAVLPLFLLLVGCPENTTDLDGDGIPDGDLDCDDLDPTVNYLAPELCDGIDNDCDGEIDEGAGAEGDWYADEDGDGFAGTDPVEDPGCDPLADGLLPEGDDCDDSDPTVFPGAPDTCNDDGIDNDCDGEIDEDADADGDGIESDACGGTDCDDSNADVLPGADEICDGLDNDCDGLLSDVLDEDDGDLDGFLDCLDDCNDDDDTIFPGAPEPCDEIDNDCDQIIDNDVDPDGDGFTGCANSGGAVDIVVVIDNSGSMEDNQEELAAQVGALFDQLVAEAIDYQMIITTTDDPTARGGIITAGAGARAQFVANASPGTSGSGIEKPFQNGVGGATLTTGFLRPGASKAMLIVTDEDDQSDFSIPGGVQTLLDMVGGVAEFVTVSGITGGVTGCDNGTAFAISALRTDSFINATGGSWASICGADWFTALGDNLIPETGIDCDDTNADVFPGAPELCDTIDNNCDGTVDEDVDGDGFDACDQDCDEADPNVFPGNPEICDGIDNDCDGSVPADESDDDGDGVRACDDCDDTNPDMFPGNVEICDDGTDQNCNGDDGQGDDLLDLDLDTFTDCEGDCDDADPLLFPVAPEHAFDGIDNDCDGLLDGDDFTLETDIEEATGYYIFGGVGPFDFCGTSHTLIGVNPNGYLVPGDTEPPIDSSPSAFEFGQYAPILAPSWEDHDLDLIAYRAVDRFSLIAQPAVAGDPYPFQAHIAYDGTITVIIGDSSETSTGILGWSCGGDVSGSLTPNVGSPRPGPTTTGTADFWEYSGGATEGRYVWN